MRKTRRRFLAAVGASIAIAGCQDGGGPTPEPSPGETPAPDGVDEGTPTPAEGTPTPAEETPGEETPAEETPGEETPGEETPGEETPGEETPGEETPGDGGRVEVSEHEELGEILVDGEGMTLYMFDQDTQGEEASTCTDDCAENWPPLTVQGEPQAGEGVTAELTTFEREDGEMQVAANGWPLYYFAQDTAPGDANGQGVDDVWWVLDPAGEPVMDGGDGRGVGNGNGTPTDTPAP